MNLSGETLLAMWTPGLPEIIIILAVVLLIFGPKKLPELARGVAKSIKEFKKASHEVEENIREGLDQADRAAQDERKREISASSQKQPNPPSQQANQTEKATSEKS